MSISPLGGRAADLASIHALADDLKAAMGNSDVQSPWADATKSKPVSDVDRPVDP